MFVDESADLQKVAEAILQSKTVNAGQLCFAIDYVRNSPENQRIGSFKVMVTTAVKPKLVDAIIKVFEKLGDMSKLDDYPRIVNTEHFQSAFCVQCYVQFLNTFSDVCLLF